jgi:hypothetical protein
MKIAVSLLFLFVSWSALAQGAGMGPCTRYIPMGTSCYCNKGVMRGHEVPGWVQDERRKWVRPGWHVTYLKGQHGNGITCHRDQ